MTLKQYEPLPRQSLPFDQFGTDKFGTDEITSKPMKGGYILGTERMGALQRDCVARTSPPTV
jgi:hypothetical protein